MIWILNANFIQISTRTHKKLNPNENVVELFFFVKSDKNINLNQMRNNKEY